MNITAKIKIEINHIFMSVNVQIRRDFVLSL
jgi:hypothetical protein